MRILILTPDIDTRGGIARYTATLARALAGLAGDGNVHVLPLLETAATEEHPQACRVYKPVAPRLSAAAKVRFAGRALRLGVNPYDLVICTHVGLSPVAGVMCALLRTPFWVALHGSEAWRRFPGDVRWAVRRAGLLLPVSRYTAEMVAKANGIARSKMRVLYNAIPDDFAEMLTSPSGAGQGGAAASRKEKTILSVGSVGREFAYKGFDTVIRALPEVLRAVPGTRCLIVGEGDDISRLKRLARECGVGKQVEFKGGLTDAQLAACYRACDVFALPSRTLLDGREWQGEGFGRVYVEAALARKPVLGSTGGGAAEALRHRLTGLLVDPESVPEVAGRLVRLLQDPELSARMGAEGRRWALGNFTCGALRSRLADLLSSRGFSIQSTALESMESPGELTERQDMAEASGGVSWR